MEKKITFRSDQLRLEGMYNQLSGSSGAVITHPHPLYGGDMSNPVVESLVHSFNRKNITTLRFNFRGVRGSEGSHDGGVGEQEDALAAVHYLIEQGMKSILVAGYSFGSWILANMKELPAEVTGMVLVSPPIAMLPLADDLSIPLLKLVITGEEDEIAPPELIQPAVAHWNSKAHFEVIDFADHFYFGFFNKLEEALHNYLSSASEM